MIHFRRDGHCGMNGELRSSRSMTSKRGGSAPNRSDGDLDCDGCSDDHLSRGFDYQLVPSVLADPSPVKRPRPSPSSSSSSSTAALRMKSSRAPRRSSNTHSSSSTLKMAELLAIKRELTVIKVQIDGLLDCVDQMDRQGKDCSETPHSRESSVSPHQGSLSSLDRESPEPGEASEDEPLQYQHCYAQRYTHRMKQSDLEDDL